MPLAVVLRILIPLISQQRVTWSSRPGFQIGHWPFRNPKPSFHSPSVPGADDDDLALTVVFQEEMGAFLSVYWENALGKRELLAPNLFENIGLANQRTLLINRPTMGGPGKVVLKIKPVGPQYFAGPPGLGAPRSGPSGR